MPSSGRGHHSRNHSTTSKPYLKPPPSLDPVSPALSDLSPMVPAPDTTDKPGFPSYAQYKRIEAAYLCSLSPRKRDKALITQVMFDKIWDVLHQPEACTVETPQFRFWVRKMFTLSRPQGRLMGSAEDHTHELPPVVLHENRPVAVMEQLYELFCYCHEQANHGGRDKTCAVIRQHYSWVPKELTSQFVKACPTCTLKRSGNLDLAALVQEQPQRSRETRGQGQGAAISPGWPCSGGPLDPLPILGAHVRHGIGSYSAHLEFDGAPGESSFAKDCLGEENHLGRAVLWLDPPATSFSAPVPGLDLVDGNRAGLPPIRRVLSDGAHDDDDDDVRCALRALWPANAGEALSPALRQLQIARPTDRHCRRHPPFVLRIDPALLVVDRHGRGGGPDPPAAPAPAAVATDEVGPDLCVPGLRVAAGQ